MRVERARYFLAAVECGSIRAAAARCGVSQPTLSQQLALLEEELDVVLLTRSRSGVQPTPTGQSMLEPLARLVAAEDAVRSAATYSGGTYRGTVAIGAISATTESIVAPVVAELRQDHPELKFSVTESSSSTIEAKVLSGELDFGIITIPTDKEVRGLRRTTLMTSGLGVLLPTDHTLAGRNCLHWREIEAFPIVTMRAGTVLWERLHGAIAAPDIVVQAASARSAKVMVAEGAGVGIIASLNSSSDVTGLTWVPLQDAEPVEIGLVQRRDAQPSPSALIARRLIAHRAAQLNSATH